MTESEAAHRPIEEETKPDLPSWAGMTPLELWEEFQERD